MTGYLIAPWPRSASDLRCLNYLYVFYEQARLEACHLQLLILHQLAVRCRPAVTDTSFTHVNP